MPNKIDWATICDVIAFEYGWTLEDIKRLNLNQVSLLLRAIGERHRKENEAIEGMGKFHPQRPIKGVKKKMPSSNIVQMATQMGGKIEKDKDGKVKKVII